MSDQYIGEIRLFTGNYAPQGWAMCNGQLLPINENEALFALIGTMYGGDGQTNFAVPDLRGRLPVHTGTNAQTGTTFPMGSMSGTETVTLISDQLPAHTHVPNAQSTTGTATDPTNAFWADTGNSSYPIYANTAPNIAMNNAVISSVGGNQSHDNMMPYLVLTYIIALEGIYPSQD